MIVTITKQLTQSMKEGLVHYQTEHMATMTISQHAYKEKTDLLS